MASGGVAPSIPPIEDRVADASPALIYGATAVVAGLAAGATWWAPVAGDVALGLLSVGALGAGGWMYRVRSRLGRLPLDAARQMVWLGDRVALQCWLGRGRVVKQLTATAVLQRGEHTSALEASVAAVPCVGPFLVVVTPPSDGFEEHDRVRVTVETAGTGGSTRVERDSVVSQLASRYQPPVAIESGRLVFRRQDWGRVQS